MNNNQEKPDNYGLNLIVAQDQNLSSNQGGNANFAVVGKQITFTPSIFDTYNYNGGSSVHYDLLLLCAAVEYADQQRARRKTQWSRSFHITLPVVEISVWQNPVVKESLRDTLRHLTGDNWDFSFVTSEKVCRDSSQRLLPLSGDKEFVIAYSEGIDSLCVSGLFDIDHSAVRVRISEHKEWTKDGEQPFDLIPFNVRSARRESSMRSRGFKFAVITAIAAHLSKIKKIIVPESGQGALGPVLLPLHNIYPDYRNHPTFFRKMELFIQALLNFEVTYEQPRLWNTKGQTISAFLEQSKQSPTVVSSTRSCWQKRHNVQINGKRGQCGLCAACLLRRMSMYAAGVEEPQDMYTIGDLSAAVFEDAVSNHTTLSSTMLEYGVVGARHLQQLSDMSKLPDLELQQHVFEIAQAINVSEHQTLDNLRSLLLKHAEEWQDFICFQGKNSFIKNWIVGGRYD